MPHRGGKDTGMTMQVENHNVRWTSIWKLFRNERFPLESETALFVLVSALDVFMTCILLHHQTADGRQFYESNPIASFFLRQWGLPGMALYKFALVSLVAAIVQFVAGERIVTARRLCGFATVLSCLVVLYSLSLLLRHSAFI
jgi:hypothetical protein